MKQDYLLTIRIPFKAIDDVEARILSDIAISELPMSVKGNASVKLQGVFKDQPPRSIEINKSKEV